MHLRICKTDAKSIQLSVVGKDGQTKDLITSLSLVLGGTIKVRIETDVNKMHDGQVIDIEV